MADTSIAGRQSIRLADTFRVASLKKVAWMVPRQRRIHAIFWQRSKSMGQLLDSAIQFLNDDGWKFTQSDDNDWVSLNFTGKTGSWLSWFQDRGTVLVAYAVCPTKAPENRRIAVSEFINRANFDLGVGNFEMSFETGTIRYKSGVHVRDEHLSMSMAASMFYIANRTMDDYFSGIMAVIYGDIAPELAVARAEEAIALARKPASPDEATSVETPADDGTPPISGELATLLATLSSGIGAQAEGEGEQHVTPEDFASSEVEVGPPLEL